MLTGSCPVVMYFFYFPGQQLYCFKLLLSVHSVVNEQIRFRLLLNKQNPCGLLIEERFNHSLYLGRVGILQSAPKEGMTEMGRLTGKVAIITGAASGMGLAGAQLFAKEGAKVVATDVVEGALQERVNEIVANGGEAIALKLDVSSPESWKAVVDATISKYGKIDILVNNAGIHIAKGILEAELDDWEKVMSINSTGVWLGMKSVIPHMQKNGQGSIVNTASIAAIIGGISDGHGAAYSASKGAVRALTKHAAQWFAKDQIRVNSVHPGAIFTGMVEKAGIKSQVEMGTHYKNLAPLSPHAGESMDIANAYLYLASDESKFVTGIELTVDGGWISN